VWHITYVLTPSVYRTPSSRVLSIRATPRYIYNGNDGNVVLEAYTDADWGSNLDDRRSVSGIMIMIGGAPVVFKSKYQRTVALSSAEAEYMALSLCTQEVLWTRAMLKDLGHEQAGATQVWEDNQGAIALASNVGYNARTKHVDIKPHFIRENVARGIITVDYIGTEDQLADMLTKALGTKLLKFLVESSGIHTKPAQHETASGSVDMERRQCAPRTIERTTRTHAVMTGIGQDDQGTCGTFLAVTWLASGP